MRGALRRLLVRGVLLSLLLPAVLGIVIGLGALLSSLGDASGGRACARVALVIGVAWIVSIAATAVTSSIIVLDGPAGRGHPGDRRRFPERDPRGSDLGNRGSDPDPRGRPS